MQIPIASSLYLTPVVIRRPKIWSPNFYSPYFSIGNVFMKTWSIMIPTTRIMMQQCVGHTAPTLTVLVKKYTSCQNCGLVKIQIARHILCSIRLWCFFCGQGVLPVQFCKAVDFTLALLYPNFKLQYLMNYNSDFNNFCRFQLLAVCTTLL